MKWIRLALLVTAMFAVGCEQKQQQTEHWEEVQFKVALRSESYEPGDAITSGEFEDVLRISLPVQVKKGPGEAHVIKNNVWLHVAWDDLTVQETLGQLGFNGFRSRIENRFTSPYGTSWWDDDWQKLGNVDISTEWDSFQTSVGIDASGNDPRIWCRMWRWVKNSHKPNVVLGEKKNREPAASTDG